MLPAGLMSYGVSVPGGYYGFLRWAMWCWVILGIAWAVIGVRWWLRDPPERLWRLWPLAVFPVLLVASWWTASTDLIGKATFAHHRAALERLADRAPTPQDATTHVGPYAFYDLVRMEGCVLYSLRGPAMALTAGFAWCPGAPPIELHWDGLEMFVERIEGDWYTFVVPFRGETVDPWGLQVTKIDSVGHV